MAGQSLSAPGAAQPAALPPRRRGPRLQVLLPTMLSFTYNDVDVHMCTLMWTLRQGVTLPDCRSHVKNAKGAAMHHIREAALRWQACAADMCAWIRLSLWAEHLGGVLGKEKVLSDPSSLACLRRLHEIASANWAAYAGDPKTPMQGHLMAYPYQVHGGSLSCALCCCVFLPALLTSRWRIVVAVCFSRCSRCAAEVLGGVL